MKSKLLALMLFAGSSLFAGTHWSFGFGINTGPRYGYYAPPPPPPVVRYVAPSPGYGYVYVPGYYQPAGPRWTWRAGYWTRPPYARARWVAPRYHARRYYDGYWRRY